ncbi:hypothetical protein ANRL4_00428 [Anaerolineae bacterium]|nr:hypothetical protein ANRL4_00428 [Anaerolineae bacterium]
MLVNSTGLPLKLPDLEEVGDAPKNLHPLS